MLTSLIRTLSGWIRHANYRSAHSG